MYGTHFDHKYRILLSETFQIRPIYSIEQVCVNCEIISNGNMKKCFSFSNRYVKRDIFDGYFDHFVCRREEWNIMFLHLINHKVDQ